MSTFYFTYGSDERFPYQGGWSEVEAPTLKDACDLFRLAHPQRDPTVPVGNYAEVYTEEEFRETSMQFTGNRGARCHERISLMRQPHEGAGSRLFTNCFQPLFVRLLKVMTDMARTNPENILKSDLRVSGSILLNSGVEEVIEALDLPGTYYEEASDGKGPLLFTIGRFNDIEVLQVDPLEDEA